MYEQHSHSLLNEILIALKPELKHRNPRHFYTRLGANFYAIHSLFSHLYGRRPDFREQIQRLVETMLRHYLERSPALQRSDLGREQDYNWFLNQQWVGMALYANGFAGNLKGLYQHVAYLQELGVNMVHVMPVLDCPPGKSDGGYAVRDFRKIDERIGTTREMEALAAELKQRDILLVLDVVVNHTSDTHAWAEQARAGDQRYQDYYYMFDDREIPDQYEAGMPEIFPETAPGNFTFDERMGKWVMTVFNRYQWDLNYTNPAVFIEVLDIILFWANRGADIIRLDAVAFLWKKIGSTCQNEREAHLILQLLKDCCQVTAPGVLFIAEAIVAPVEIIKYFGEDAINAKECEIAYNATFMALLWDAVATRSALLLQLGIRSLPDKLERATWLNYVRCHDDIGLGFDDNDIVLAGYDPRLHRRFLVDWYTGRFDTSPARGLRFGENLKTGDARIAGSLASLVGVENALESGDVAALDAAIDTILLLHGMIMSFGGIPLLYYGDEIALLNDYGFRDDEHKSDDVRWVHRSQMDWGKAERRHQVGTVEQRVFSSVKKMIAIRKEIPAFADFNNRVLHETSAPGLFVFLRFDPIDTHSRVLVVANFGLEDATLVLDELKGLGLQCSNQLYDLYSGNTLRCAANKVIIAPLRFHWLAV